MISKLKFIFRKLIGAKEKEGIVDALIRKRIKVEKKFYRKNISKIELKDTLIKMGIKKGDNIMVHASWRQFYNFLGKPQDVIKILKDIIGPEGMLLMPSYGSDRLYFDVENTPSSAGVLSEVFRLGKNTYRSACTHFSVCAYGKNASEIIEEHFFSEYGFDNRSPYYKFTKLENSKVLFMGLGKEPTKISLFHCAGYLLKDKIDYSSEVLSKEYTSVLIINNKKYKKDMIIRTKGHKNNNKVFKKIFRNIKTRKHIKLSNLDLVWIDAREGLNKAIEFAEEGIYCYK